MYYLAPNPKNKGHPLNAWMIYRNVMANRGGKEKMSQDISPKCHGEPAEIRNFFTWLSNISKTVLDKVFDTSSHHRMNDGANEQCIEPFTGL
jgi:hypothetical protein